MNEIETYKTITVTKVIPINTATFTADINIDFIPDEIVLKNVSFFTGTSYDRSFMLTSSLIGDDQILATLPKSSSFHESYNIPFKNSGRPIQGNYTFEIREFTKELFIKASVSYLSFTLVFIKWKTHRLSR